MVKYDKMDQKSADEKSLTKFLAGTLRSKCAREIRVIVK